MVSTEQFLTLEFFGIIPQRKYIILLEPHQNPIQGHLLYTKKKKIKIFRTKIVKKLKIFGQYDQILIFNQKVFVKCSDYALEIIEAEDNNNKNILSFLKKKIMKDSAKKFLKKNNRLIQVCTKCIYDEDILKLNLTLKAFAIIAIF